MADFILARKSRNVASSMVHILLNLLLGVGAVLITVLSASPLFGLLIVMSAKWRVFAVRPRYFFLNLKSNLVDIIVGISIVLLTYYSGSSLVVVDFLLMVIYSIWLIIIKPLSSESATLTQSLIAVFLGVSTATIITANFNPLILVLLTFLIGYSASRHVLVQASDQDYTLTTLVCGLIFAEIAWLSHFWMIIYTFGSTGIRIPQLAIILTVFTFVYNYARQIILKLDTDFRLKNILAPAIFSLIIIAIIVLWFSNPVFNI